MRHAGNASGRWNQLDGLRRGFITRCETYAHYTLPKICTPSGYDQNTSELQHDFQAVGAQAVNHLANKIMLALFAPSRPFFRLDASRELKAELMEAGVTEAQLTEILALGEKEAIAELDKLAMRPKLFEAVKHLIVTGNVLLDLSEDEARVIGLKKYVARRSQRGKLLECIIADKLTFDELDPEVQEQASRYYGYTEDKEVTHYLWITRNANGDYVMDQWVDEFKLPKKFSGKWSEADLPYRVLTWDLSDDAHYGTGLVEDYKGDFAGLSTLTKAQITGAILSSEFRWLVNPAGQTRVEDFENSENGAAIPGEEGDIVLVQSGKAADLNMIAQVNAEYVNRIARGFLLGSAVTRDAERVTAEEIRMQAQELETSLGGAYSRLAVDFQIPMAYWLLEMVNLTIQGKGVRPSIVTGLDALSRSGDLEELKLWLADMVAVSNIPPGMQARLRMDELAKALAAPRRIKVDQYLKSEEQFQQEQQALQQQQAQLQAAQVGAETAGKIAVEGAKSQGSV